MTVAQYREKRGPALIHHANPLIPRATVPANDIRALVDALGQLGYDTETLLSEIGLRRMHFDDPEARLSIETYPALLTRVQQQRFTPNLALHLAAVTPMGAFPLLDYLVLTCDSVGAGILQLARYYRLTGSPVVIEVRDDSDYVDVVFGGRSIPFGVEYGISLAVLRLREETVGHFTPAKLQFEHRPDDSAEFERILGCPVQINARWSGMRVTRENWNVPLRRRDPMLRTILERQANDIVAKLPESGDMVSELSRMLESHVASGDTCIESVARKLGVSSRTLQRRLAGEGKTYQLLLDGARKIVAGRHVSEARLAICEVAFLLGYSEPAAFHRAFKRWYGVTPQSFRTRATMQSPGRNV